MYFGYNNNAPSSNMTQQSSILHESQVLSLQRESENYIRKVEQEKKHFYSIEENYQSAKKDWQEKKEELKQIQFAKTLPKAKQKINAINNLQHQLEQTILKFNESQTLNQNLKGQINMLRKERAQYKKIHKQVETLLKKIQEETAELDDHICEVEVGAEKKKQLIAELKRKNDSEKEAYVNQFDRLKREVLEEKRRHEASNMAQRKEKPANIDTATLLKLRIKKIIANNKEKVRLIDQYSKNMKVIEDAFAQIKEASGINDIEEITNTFIKSEEQNYSLYNYVDILSQQIDQLNDQHQELKGKIELQLHDNEAKRRLLMATPQATRHQRKNDAVIKKRQDEINGLRSTMNDISPLLMNVLIELSQTSLASDPMAYLDYKLAFNLNESSLEKYLQDLEYYVDLAVAKDKLAQNMSISQTTLLLDEIPQKEFKSQHKQFNDDDLPKVEKFEKELLNYKSLRDLAVETLKKKK